MTLAQGNDISALRLRGNLILAIAFTGSIFLSACLLFFVQPMFTKMALPYLGGAPNVWNTAMVFFQAMLLGGYIYAHVISKYLPMPAQIAVHAVVLLSGLLFLPIAIGVGVTPTIEAPAFDWAVRWCVRRSVLCVVGASAIVAALVLIHQSPKCG